MNTLAHIILVTIFFVNCSFQVESSVRFVEVKLQENLIQRVMRQVGLNEQSVKMDLVALKKLPHKPNQTVVVLPKIIFEDEMMLTLDALILVVDSETGVVIQQYKKENLIYGDAVYISSISIDTAPYLLTNDIRAFGIRVGYTGSSRANPYSEEHISLFVQEKSDLKSVLREVRVAQFNGEWDTNCAGEFHDQKSIISFETETSNGYFNLVVKTKSTTTENIPNGADCDEKTVEKQEHKTVFYFNGKSYN